MNESAHRTEHLVRAESAAEVTLAPGVSLKALAGGEYGARDLSTALVGFLPGACLPYHLHPCCEAIVLLSGRLQHIVEGRRYVFEPQDAIHIPAGVSHMARSLSHTDAAIALVSFASGTPTRTLVRALFDETDQIESNVGVPERLTRFTSAPKYELAPRTEFATLFEGRPGCEGICGGYGFFETDAGLPCHTHDYDESITIIEGQAVCQVAGREHLISTFGSVCIPRGVPHRFLNRSDQPMAMIWVYAGDHPDGTILAPCHCEPRVAMPKRTATKDS